MQYLPYLIIILLLVFNEQANCQSSCVMNKVLLYPQRYIFSYQCYAPAPQNPSFSKVGSSPTEFTELVLAPNVYTYVPTDNICQFLNITLLDLSSNLITNINSVFIALKCLTKLTKISLANNEIRMDLKSTDFDDIFSSQLKFIDLSLNQILSIETGVFIKSDGTSRFKNLEYLSLKGNLLQQFDLLWPLAIPYSGLLVDMSNNPITTLVNELNLTYRSSVFAYSVAGGRNVIVQNNQLKTFSDSNLLQYGLQSAYDLALFFNKIKNYDFRLNNASNSSTVICNCPLNGLLTATWYQQLLTTLSIDTTAIINQFYCSNIPNAYPLNIMCLVSLKTTVFSLF